MCDIINTCAQIHTRDTPRYRDLTEALGQSLPLQLWALMRPIAADVGTIGTVDNPGGARTDGAVGAGRTGGTAGVAGATAKGAEIGAAGVIEVC